MRKCSECGQDTAVEKLLKCVGCKAVLFCSSTCRDATLSTSSIPHSHKQWCDKMASYMTQTEALASLPFTYSPETTSADFDLAAYKAFLKKYGVFGRGFWIRECIAPSEECGVRSGLLDIKPGSYVLPLEGNILSKPPDTQPPYPIEDWISYYKWRGLSLDSPMAILLSHTLTVYHIITDYCSDFPSVVFPLEKFVVHLIGVEREVDQLYVFEELTNLLPNIEHLELVMIGKEVSKKVDKKSVDLRNMTITIRKGLYHKVAPSLQRPDVVIGLNAGLAAYQAWCGTLLYLKHQRLPTYFSDYCQYSCDSAQLPVEGLSVGKLSPVTINPFRSPVRKYCEEHLMPWYSNAFMYQLEYG